MPDRRVGGVARVALTLAIAVTAPPARAAGAASSAPAQVEAALPKRRLAWNPAWHRFRGWEYAGTILVGGTSLYLHDHRVLPAQPRWQGDNPFDDTLRDGLRADFLGDRLRASNLSDLFQNYAPFVTYLADAPVILIVDHDVRLSWEILMMDLEAYAVAGFITNTLFMTVGRARPLYASCIADRSYDPLCGGAGVNASFPSGHTLTVGTAAGLMCVHHHYLPIYGHPVADRGACGVMILATLTTAAARVIADRHWASDALFSAVLGFGIGYGLPWSLHYRAGTGPEKSGRLAIVPFGTASSAGLEIVGAI